MKVALIGLQLGVRYTLATTAFISALADGLERIDVPVRIISLVHWESGWGDRGWEPQWNPEAIRPFEASAPWICAPRQRLRDAVEATRLGILDTPEDATEQSGSPDWYLELLLERELKRFADGDPDLAVMIYPISYQALNTLARITKRCGWRLIVQSCEAMSGAWIEAATKDEYIAAVAGRATGMWALSGFLADYWESQGLPRERILVHPSIVRMSSFVETGPPRRCVATYLGNLQHKEVDYLLEIAEITSRSLSQFRLRVFGDATAERRAELAEELGRRGLAEVITLEQPVEPTAVPGILAQADVLLLPRSQGEFSQAGFPNKLGEYLASGRPVVVTRVGDIPKYLVDRESAFLVDPDDCRAFAAAVVEVLTDRGIADRMGERGAKVAQELLASPRVAQRIVDFIESLPRPQREVTSTVSVHKRAQLIIGRLARLGAHAGRRILLWLRHLVRRVYWAIREGMRRTYVRARYTAAGTTRVMSLKMAIVKLLRALGLRPPAP